MSGRRSGQNSYRPRKQSSPCSTKTKSQVPASHEEPLLQENQADQPLSLASQICLSAILKYVASNILELVGNEAPSNCRVQRAATSNPQRSPRVQDDADSQAAEMF